MKFNIEIEVDDLFQDMFEDDRKSFERSLIESIKYDVIRQIKIDTQEQVKKEITQQIINEVRNTVTQRINIYIDEFINKGILHEGTPSEITIKNFLYSVFTNTRQWENLLPSIKKVAESFTIEIKNRYDLAFASTILTNLKEQKLLNNNALKALFKE